MKRTRVRVWIHRFQTYLVLRIAVFFLLYQVILWSLLTLWRGLSGTIGQLVGHDFTVPLDVVAAVAWILVGALFLYDAMKFAHRLVGPMYRFRKMMQAITAGEEMQLMRLREGDFLQELKDDFNDMLRALEQRGAIKLQSSPQQQQQQQQTSESVPQKQPALN